MITYQETTCMFIIYSCTSVFGIDIQFEWIPAYCDLLGNERADSLAKNATQKEHIDVTVPRNRSELTNHMRHCYQHLWQNQWETIDKGRFLFQIHPHITRLIK